MFKGAHVAYREWRDQAGKALSSGWANLAFFVAGVALALFVEDEPGLAVALGLGVVLIVLGWVSVVIFTEQRPSSHWEVISSRHTWTINDMTGTDALVSKNIIAKCRADGVTTWEDLITGESTGITMADMSYSVGNVVDIKPYGPYGTKVLVHLHHVCNKGDELHLEATRKLRGAFTGDQEYVGLKMRNYQAGPAEFIVKLPPGAACQDVKLETLIGARQEDTYLPNAVQQETLAGNQTRPFIAYTIKKPKTGWQYALAWKWNPS